MSTTTLARCIQNHCCTNSDPHELKKHNTKLHIATIVKRGKVLAIATNKVGSRSKGSGYSDNTLHAEKAVVKKLGDVSRLRGAVLCVWRISQVNILPSKPCSECTKFLEKCMKEYGLRTVQYTDTCTPF